MPAVLHRLAGPSAVPDAELVRRFRDGRDGEAFAALVYRYGPMVFGVCRRMLPSHHDAEDAFQATFLVLACKPDAVRPPERVGAWLHGVACRVCLKARRAVARRLATERVAVERVLPSAIPPPDDLSGVLDEVLLGLPEKYRLPVVECHLAGRSRKEAAARLGWSEGTLSGRLARALDLLADRLTRRGVGLSAAALAGVLSARPLRANVPDKLAASTVTVADLVADGLPVPAGPADTLSRGVMNAMWWTKCKTAILAGVAAGLVLAGVGFTGLGRATADPPAKAEPPVATTAPAAPKPAAKGWMTTQTLKRDHPITVLAVGPAGLVAVGDEGGSLCLWEPKNGKEPAVLLKGGADRGRTTSVDQLGFTPDRKYVYMITNGGRMIGRTEFGKKDRPGGGIGANEPRLLGFSADGDTWIEKSNKVSSFVLRPNPMTQRPASPGYENVDLDADITHLAASTDGQLVAAVTAEPAVRLIERDGHKTRWKVDVPNLAATAVRFSADGKLLALVGENGFAAVYDAATGKEAVALKGLDGIVPAVAFSPDGTLLATGGQDHTARVWDAATGKQLAVLKGHTDTVRDLAFGPDGKTLVTGSADKTVCVWEFKE